MTLDLVQNKDAGDTVMSFPGIPEPMTPNTLRAVVDVIAERRAQYTQNRWTTRHDDRAEVNNELSLASIAYTLAAIKRPTDAEMFYPWGRAACPVRDDTNPKRRGFRALLVKAAALLIAAIEQIDRGNVK